MNRRTDLERTLRGIAASLVQLGASRWRGWQHHRGELGPPLSWHELTIVERRMGRLPADYREFVLHVAASGAGPGYGLLSPLHESSAKTRPGTFSWHHNTAKAAPAAGCIPLAHAGCGIFWVLVLDGARAGEVWVDSSGSDGHTRRVSGSFGEWYRGWLSAEEQNAQPWLQWDPERCSTLSQLDRNARATLTSDSISLVTKGNDYVGDRTINPCQGCVSLAQRMHLSDQVFAAGVEPALNVADAAPHRHVVDDLVITNRVRQIIAAELAIDVSQLDDTTRLDQLQLEGYEHDELEVGHLVMVIENDFSIRLPDEAMTNLHTVADFAAYVKAGVPQHASISFDADSDADQTDEPGGSNNLSAEAATANLRNFIASHLALDIAQLVDHVTFSDLGVDEPDVCELIMAIEDEFGLQMLDIAEGNVNTLADLLRFATNVARRS